jgi:hypothetical protein
MKRMTVYGMTALILVLQLCFAAAVRAEESGEEKVSTLLILKNDLVSPQQGKSFFSQTISGYWHYKWIGGGGDFTYTPRKDFLEMKPYVTVNKGPFYALLGYSGNSLEQKYVQVGGWYWNTFGKLTVFVDVRNYCATNKSTVSYLDAWISAYYKLGDRFYIGAENRVAHWWDPKKDHNQVMLGPLAGINITKTTSVYVRPSVSWDMVDGITKRDFCVRVGWKTVF